MALAHAENEQNLFVASICILYYLKTLHRRVTMVRLRKSSVIRALGITLAVFVFASRPALESRSGHSHRAGLRAGALIVHSAIKYDVSRPLASMRELNDRTSLADCEGAACGASPGVLADDSDAAQGRRRDEPIPPTTPPPTLSLAGIAVEQTSQGTRSAVPLLES